MSMTVDRCKDTFGFVKHSVHCSRPKVQRKTQGKHIGYSTLNTFKESLIPLTFNCYECELIPDDSLSKTSSFELCWVYCIH